LFPFPYANEREKKSICNQENKTKQKEFKQFHEVPRGEIVTARNVIKFPVGNFDSTSTRQVGNSRLEKPIRDSFTQMHLREAISTGKYKL
jgi:hypothetical protein